MAGKKINIDSLNLGLDSPGINEANKIFNRDISIIASENFVNQNQVQKKFVQQTKKNIKKTVTIDETTFNMIKEIKKNNYHINISELLRESIKDYHKKIFNK